MSVFWPCATKSLWSVSSRIWFDHKLQSLWSNQVGWQSFGKALPSQSAVLIGRPVSVSCKGRGKKKLLHLLTVKWTAEGRYKETLSQSLEHQDIDFFKNPNKYRNKDVDFSSWWIVFFSRIALRINHKDGITLVILSETDFKMAFLSFQFKFS